MKEIDCNKIDIDTMPVHVLEEINDKTVYHEILPGLILWLCQQS